MQSTTLQSCGRPVYIPLGTFDESKLFLSDPVLIKSKKIEGAGVVKSTWLYKDDKGDLCEPFFQGAEQTSGMYPVEDMNDKGSEGNKSPPKKGKAASSSKDTSSSKGSGKPITGYQITYPITSRSTMDSPTDDELATKLVFDTQMKIVGERMQQFTLVKDTDGNFVLPKSVKSKYDLIVKVAKAEGKDVQEALHEWLKPIYEHPKTQDKKALDKSKPKRAYIKLDTFGKDDALVCKSKIFKRGTATKHNPKDLLNSYGRIQPVFKMGTVYFGANPQTEHVVYCQNRLDMGRWYPSDSETPVWLPPTEEDTEELSREDKTKDLFASDDEDSVEEAKLKELEESETLDEPAPPPKPAPVQERRVRKTATSKKAEQ